MQGANAKKFNKLALTILFTVGLIGWLSPSLHASAYELKQEAQGGVGVLFKNGYTDGYYRTSSVSYGHDSPSDRV